jgi:lipopolysaccharide heptosyltransferase II
MHILQLLPSLEVGGVERGVIDLAGGLVARGHEVSVISSGGALVETLLRLGAAHYELPVHRKSLVSIRSCIPAVARIILDGKIDVVHARSRVPGWIGYAAARRTQRPFVTTAHGFYRPHLASRVMVWGRPVIVPSEALARYVMEHFNVPRDRLQVIPRGVNLEEFTFQPPRPGPRESWRIGLFSRVSSLKGHAVALRACERLIQRGLPVTLCLAGDIQGSPARQSLESLIATLRLDERVEWLGVRRDIPALIASVDIVVVPSTYPESFGRGVIEAQAVGRPVVASRIGALPELIDEGRTGLLVPPGDPAALAAAVHRLITDDKLRERCVAEGRTHVEAEGSAEQMVERTLAVYEDRVTRPRILIWKLSALGDVILSTPSLRAIRRQFPASHITLAVGRSAYEVAARCPYLNDILIVDLRGKDRGPAGRLRLLRRLRAAGFDLSIDLQNSRRTHLLTWLSGVPARIGYRRKFGWLLNRGVRLPKVVLAPIAHQHYLLTHAGIAPDGDRLELWPSALDEARAESLLEGVREDGKPVAAVHPGGSGRWMTKRWDLERWAAVCDALAERGARVIVIGGPEERVLGETLSSLTRHRPLLLAGQTSLLELACVLKRSDLFLGHDSSSLHVAAAVGAPAVALFGPTDPRRHLPPSFAGTVIRKDVFCSPCYSARCRTVTHACMKRISIEEVLAAALAILADRETAST